MIAGNMTNETVTINIGGAVFETYRSTLLRLPNSPLSNDVFMAEHYRPERKDYFFDREPDMFKVLSRSHQKSSGRETITWLQRKWSFYDRICSNSAVQDEKVVLNYLRTGELHIPSYICGPTVKTELVFWGVPPYKIARCCSNNYANWNSTIDAMNVLNQDREGSGDTHNVTPNLQRTCWSVNQPKIWNILTNPGTSIPAMIYGCVSFFMVLLSILEGTAQTVHIDSTPLILKMFTIVYILCNLFFLIEIVMRFVFAPKKKRFLIMPLNIIDALVLLSSIADMVIEGNIDFLIIKLFRILRIFRLIKHTSGFWVLVYTIKASIKELILFLCFMFIGQLFFATFVYVAEYDEMDTHFRDIPDALWWAVITMTTVGYGDLRPVTRLGQGVASVCAVTGIIMICFLVSAIISNYNFQHKRIQRALKAYTLGEQTTLVNANNASLLQCSGVTFTNANDSEKLVFLPTGNDDTKNI